MPLSRSLVCRGVALALAGLLAPAAVTSCRDTPAPSQEDGPTATAQAALLPAGSACSADGDCTSGACAGNCCNAPCAAYCTSSCVDYQAPSCDPTGACSYGLIQQLFTNCLVCGGLQGVPATDNNACNSACELQCAENDGWLCEQGSVTGVCSNGACVAPDAGQTASANCAPTGAMETTRFGHTATLLPSGKVLIAGGLEKVVNTTYDIYLSSAELYDPTTGTFAPTGALAAARAFHTATLLPSGKVLLAGGEQQAGSPPTAELYDPTAGTFTASSGRLGLGVEVTVYHTATLLPSGQVLIAGGNGAEAWLYDPAADTFTETGSLTAARAYHTATLLGSGQVLVAGGYDNGAALASAELYDPVAGTFGTTGAMTVARAQLGAVLLASGQVLVAGGFSDSGEDPIAGADLYDPTGSGSFAAAAPMTTPRTWYRATRLGSGRVLATGGLASAGGSVLSSAEIYDPATSSFALTGSLTTPRSFHTATLLQSGRVLITGGDGASGYGTDALSSAEVCSFHDPGDGCFSGADCLSGFCVDGVCCSTACSAGACNACSVAAGADVDGTCTLLTGPSCSTDACTPSTCQAGACVAAAPVVCAPLDACHVAGTCDPTTGACSSPAAPNGTACNDGACQAGTCVSPPVDAGAGGGSTTGAGGSPPDAGSPVDAGTGGSSPVDAGAGGSTASASPGAPGLAASAGGCSTGGPPAEALPGIGLALLALAQRRRARARRLS